uniref:Uncharacterized protein n=1 Tax=Manihot esculenta TaxID=3983 RepID=A0A2C9W4Z2_MANES
MNIDWTDSDRSEGAIRSRGEDKETLTSLKREGFGVEATSMPSGSFVWDPFDP